MIASCKEIQSNLDSVGNLAQAFNLIGNEKVSEQHVRSPWRVVVHDRTEPRPDGIRRVTVNHRDSWSAIRCRTTGVTGTAITGLLKIAGQHAGHRGQRPEDEKTDGITSDAAVIILGEQGMWIEQ